MSEDEDDGEGTVKEVADGRVSDVEILQEAVEDAVAAKNGFPGVAADEVANPERDNHELIEKLFARAGMEREVIGERVSEEEGTEHNASGDAHGAEEDFGVEGISE